MVVLASSSMAAAAVSARKLTRLIRFALLLQLGSNFLSRQSTDAENVYCTYYRDTNEVTCGTVTCETAVPLLLDQPNLDVDGLDAKLPRGWYRIGVMQVRHDHGWFNLYRRRATGQGYWDFYTQVPERNCIGGFGMHAGENMAGTVTLKDKRCFDRLANQIERKSTTEKFDVLQCRKCIFNSCWLGIRTLPDQRVYLTNLRSY